LNEAPLSPPYPERPSARELVDGLVRLLTIERCGPDSFVGHQQPGGVGRVFGGQVVAQGLQAAQATAPEGFVAHSLHAYFLRGGKEGQDIALATERDFDGRSFANRRVVAAQEEVGEATPILNLTASFQRPERGLEHQDAAMPQVTAPEDLPTDIATRERLVAELGHNLSDAQKAFFLRPRPIDMRTDSQLHWMNAEPKPPRAYCWFRTDAQLPDDPNLHRAVIAYASDYTLLGTSAQPHGLSWARGEIVSASLDHAIWFHAEARADEWLLYSTDSPWTGSGRGFNRGQIFTRDGTLVASVAQEGMIRKRIKKKDA
jgi:acyl-CoA thioesterase-2